MIVTLLEDDNGDLVLPISEELISHQGWSDGTILQWTDNHDGSFTLSAFEDSDE